MIKALQIAFKDLLRTLRKLFLEMTGFFFLVVGGIILVSGYRQLRVFLNIGEVSYFKLISTLIFGILMVGYGIHSFIQVKKV
jgi:hypothetical protein